MKCENILDINLDNFENIENGLTVEQIIKILSQYRKDLPISIMINNELYSSDFNTYSWRGSFKLPAIQYEEYSSTPYSVETAIANLSATHQKEVTGYKGGDYKLSLQDVLYIANCDTSGNDTAVVGIREQNGTVILFTRPGMY